MAPCMTYVVALFWRPRPMTTPASIAANVATPALAVTARCSADGSAWLAQNWDWIGRQREALVVLKSIDDAGQRITTLTEAGMLAKIGFNESGFALGLNIVRSLRDGESAGVPVHVLLRHLLSCRSVAHARASTVAWVGVWVRVWWLQMRPWPDQAATPHDHPPMSSLDGNGARQGHSGGRRPLKRDLVIGSGQFLGRLALRRPTDAHSVRLVGLAGGASHPRLASVLVAEQGHSWDAVWPAATRAAKRVVLEPQHEPRRRCPAGVALVLLFQHLEGRLVLRATTGARAALEWAWRRGGAWPRTSITWHAARALPAGAQTPGAPTVLSRRGSHLCSTPCSSMSLQVACGMVRALRMGSHGRQSRRPNAARGRGFLRTICPPRRAEGAAAPPRTPPPPAPAS